MICDILYSKQDSRIFRRIIEIGCSKDELCSCSTPRIGVGKLAAFLPALPTEDKGGWLWKFSKQTKLFRIVWW